MSDPQIRHEDPVIPVATYRLQFSKQFTFAEATRHISYLRRLGISHCYASPYLKACPGSEHGYDIVDHSEINPEIGSYEDFERFIAELQNNGMGLIADIVPNHMAIMDSSNAWWMDVLENGQSSSYASFFDIDWYPVKKTLQNKILLPVLSSHYGNTLEQQELQLTFDAGLGEFSVNYYQHRCPIDPQTYSFILSSQHQQLQRYFAADDLVFLEYQTIDNSFSKLPFRTETAEEIIEERNRDKEVFKKQLAKLCADNLPLVDFINFRVAEINRIAGEDGELHALLEQQVYRLAYWRVAGDEINYRRFFDINELAGLRIEDDKVFDASHQLILSLIEQRKIQGLRIDHADGLHDPVGYYQHLNNKISAILNVEVKPDTPPIYIVAEKIVANYEYLSSNWPIHGTTGYEFANIVNGVFIDAAAERQLTHCYVRFIGHKQDFEELVYAARKYVMTTALASELNVLANQLSKIADASSKTRDYTLYGVRNALSEVVACFPVYRTYINSQTVSKEDSQYINWAIEHAKQRSRAADKTVFEFVRHILLQQHKSGVAAKDLLKFVMKFQQYTPPVMAKGHEDTGLYLYNRLISLNEVGGDPRNFGNSVNAFHYFNQGRVKKWPHTMLCLSTHDTKHSADMRARVNVLSEIPRQWQETVFRWRRLNKSKKTKMTKAVIARNDEYLFYQVLIGTWPLTRLTDAELAEYQERIRTYMIKAVREAKQYTSWLNPNEEYEQAVSQFIRRCLNANSSFLTHFVEFERQIRKPGLYNALAQAVLHTTAPGMPDIYQGNELWQFSLVDPDNRRPVDFSGLGALLAEMEAALAKPGLDRPKYINSLLETIEDGRIKLFVVTQTLHFRHHYAALFRDGEYLKIDVHGTGANQLLAFARKNQNDFAVIVVPRLITRLLDPTLSPSLDDVWADTWLELPENAPRQYRELFSRCKVTAEPVGDNLQLCVHDPLTLFPIAVLSGVAE
jgi:(1->4)-alpha-D-glucan 1-alpha-D-glucosylmutase